MRAFSELWDEIAQERYGIDDPKKRIFRYGVQVNSLGLTEQQPENNVHRILIEMLAVTLSKRARARAVQLPAWNEALGLPRPWDQQWSMRMQQILAFETDLLEYDDIFDGSTVIDAKVEALKVADPGRAGAHRRHRRRGRGGRDRRAQARAGRIERPAHLGDRGRRADRRRRQQVAAGRALAADRRGGRDLHRAPRPSRWRREARIRDWRAKRDDDAVGQARSTSWKRRRARAPTSCRPRSRPRRPASPPASGASACARSSASTARPTGVTLETVSSGAAEEAKLLIADLGERLGEHAAARRRQARPRRPFERRRADRAARPRRRLRRDLRRHPPDPGRDRRQGARRPAPTWSASRSCRARHVPLVREVRAQDARGRPRPHPGRGRRHHLARGRARAQEHGRLGGLHAEGLRHRQIMVGLAKVVEKSLDRRDGLSDRPREEAQVY